MPRTPSGPGWLVARVRTRKLVGLAGSYSGSSGISGMKMVPLLPLETRSRPWSKNWPKKVNQELKGAESPSSGVVLGMKKTSRSSGVLKMPSRPGLRTGAAPPLASTAAGLLAVWSTIRLLMIRGSASATLPGAP
ncbi:hypothetical protein D9M68_672740 [compost metagenome]